MAFDGGMLRAVISEINRHTCGAKVERVLQPAQDEIDLLLSLHGKKERLAILAGNATPHLSLSSIAKENPAQPPMLCMLLRKHLGGSKFLGGEQIGFERVARLRFSGYDEMGYATEKSLIVEIMGKYSNLMLVDADDRVLAVLRPVDFTTSRRRQVLVGMRYEMPPAQDKADPTAEGREGFFARLSAASPEKSAATYLTSAYLGIASHTAAEIVCLAGGRQDASIAEVGGECLFSAFSTWFADLRAEKFTPTLVLSQDGELLDYTYAPSTYRGGAAKSEEMPSFSALLDRFFGERDLRARMHHRAADLYRLLNNAEGRLERKLGVQREELAACDRADEYRRLGDLTVANLWRLSRGATELLATEYTDEGEAREVLVPLDGRLSPSANAQRYYKLYNKAKKAREILTEQIAKSEAELVYLDGVRGFLDRAESEADLLELREELSRAGYASRARKLASPGSGKLRPRTYTTKGGYTLLCGRNNLQNDDLTFRRAGKDDLWFHAKGVHGSHVLLLCSGGEPSSEDYTHAAQIAAYYSGAQNGEQVAVDYTRVRHIKKPPAAKPGYVTYKTNYTAYVTPALPLPEGK